MQNQPTRKKRISLALLLLAVLLCMPQSDCFGKKAKTKKEDKKTEAPKEQPLQIDKSIGDLAEVMAYNPIPVKGVGIVVGLSGTGSSECPPAVRDYLRQYIRTQVGQRKTVDPDTMINSKDTAVVLVEGFIPPGAVKQEAFDVSVTALSGTQTTSLEGGRLYTAELKFVSRVEEVVTSSKTLALAAGTVYIDNVAEPKPDPRTGYVLGGGKVMQKQQLMLAIYNPNFRTVAIIRNRINQRFGKDTANAASESIIYLTLPEQFNDRKVRFIELVKSLYIGTTAVAEDRQMFSLVEKLKTESEKEKYETGLEAIGKPAIEKLLPLLDSENIQVRFSAARCLLNIGDDRALKDLRDFAQDTASPVRLAAIEAVGNAGGQRNVITLMSRLVRDDDFNVRFTAYKFLQQYDDASIIRTTVGKDFYIDQIIQLSPKTVYVSRKDEARIVLFGAPIDCEKDIFIESDDGQIIINTLPDENRISIMRKHPITGELMGPLKTSFKLADLIKALGDEPAPEDSKLRSGLGVSYSQIVELLKKICEKGAVKAVFVSGPLTPLVQQPQQKQ
ncbi:MAG: flagellar basal body P-ring protein FlgI [Phycisphaerae bacterium]|nr:flagellar basal body P-ring protein FlgI [Phycisphaerae bacterium]